MLVETPHFAIAAEAEIGATAFNLNLTHQHTAIVPDVDAITASRIHVAEDVTFDAVGRTGVGVGEDAPVRHVRLVVFPKDGVGVNGGGTT